MKSISSSVRVWAEMVKLSHSIFALPFALVATFLAARFDEPTRLPTWGQLGLILVCMVTGRSVAMTFNRIVDARIDAANPRTANRPLPAGRLGFSAAWTMLLLSVLTFGLGCVAFYLFYDNAWPILLSGPVLLFLGGYSFTKRFTKWSHLYLGASVSLSPGAAWLAIDPESFGLSAIVLMLAVASWIAGFDIIYACQDIEVDRRQRLFSLPSRIGPASALWIARCLHVVSVISLAVLGWMVDLGYVYAIGVGVVAVMLTVENALVRPDDFSRVTVAFFSINGVVSIVMAAAAIMDVVLMHGHP